MPISEKLRAIYATAPRDDYYIETLELSHSGFPDGAIFITNQVGGWEGLLEDGTTTQVFDWLPFGVVPPNNSEESNLNLQVAIDNASVTLMEQLEALAQVPTEAIIVRYRIYLATDFNTVQNDPPLKLDILQVTATSQLLTFTAGLANLRKIQFPSLIYSTELYPGLIR